jgi:outer membrane protein assembly factor BamB
MKWAIRGTLVLSLVIASPGCCNPAPAGKSPSQDQKDEVKVAAGKVAFEIDHEVNRVVCRDAGRIRWSTPLKGYLGLVRPPHLLADTERVYVTHESGVTALDAKTGKILWRSKGPNDRLLLSGNLLLAADCEAGEAVAARGRWLVARAVATGAVVFRTALPVKGFDPESIREVVAGLFLVDGGEHPDGKGQTLLLDRKGKVRFRLDRQVVDGKQRGKDLVLLTSRDVVALGPDGRTRWAVPFEERQWVAGGGLEELPSGDLLAFLFGCISDSGVQVIRLNPTTGKAAWQVRCAPLGVTHSEYEHGAEVKVKGQRVKVTSRGSDGRFVEVLDLKSGQQLKRWSRLAEWAE